jgi:hypothetical protein
MDDHFNIINPKVGYAPLAAAVADNTAMATGWIDRQGYDSVTFVIMTGVLADADATFAVSIQDADAADQSDAAAVDASNLLGTTALASFTFANDGACFKLGYVGNKRYSKLTITPANNAGNAPLAVLALLGDPDIAPTPNPPN